MNLIMPFSGPEHQPFELGSSAKGAFLIHGFPGTPAEMRPLAQTLANQGWQSKALLLPGFGPQIPMMEKYRYQDWLAASSREWNAFSSAHHKNILIGYSMGAALALHLANTIKPDLLVLIAPFWQSANWLSLLVPVIRYSRVKLKPFKKADFSNQELRRQMEQIIPGIDLDDTAVQNQIREQFVIPTGTIHEILKLGKTAFHMAQKIQVDTLVIQGTQDPIVQPTQTKKLVAALGKNRCVYREITGNHNLLQDQMTQQQVIDLVAAHLSTKFNSLPMGIPGRLPVSG